MDALNSGDGTQQITILCTFPHIVFSEGEEAQWILLCMVVQASTKVTEALI